MELRVLQTDSTTQPWYSDGLRFTCSQCGNCCTGEPGYVWISRKEIRRLADFLKITPEQVIEQYCRKIDGRYSLREHRNHRGEYDCIFLKEEQSTVHRDGRAVVQTRRICTAYSVRPLQCRTWPFWTENLRSRQRWEQSSRRCPGMDTGDRLFTREQIEALRDAADWPQNAPTSK
jgi:Fe-S-cluster containining protein